jgi:HKD family nuclease
MNFLASAPAIESALRRLINECKTLRWAVAWASQSAPLRGLLSESRGKIEQLTVGIHFYQTDPEFIKAFNMHEHAGFVMNPDGVFHPKLYYFDLPNGKWACVVGSANFTAGGLKSNNEVAVLIGEDDVDSEASRSAILSALDQFRRMGRRLSDADLTAYRDIWKRQQRRIQPLSGNYEPQGATGRPRRSPLDVPLFTAGWGTYFDWVKVDTILSTEGRLRVLEEARRLFIQYEHLADMPIEARKGIAGIIQTEQLDWLAFGSMRGSGYFKQAIASNCTAISVALDQIPLEGPVEFRHYEAFVEKFVGAFQNSGIATGTRLLTLKRPDYFICFDSKNRKKLCENFEIPQNVTLKDYWDKVVERLIDANWWNSSEPTGELERRIWAGRAAFLDVLFYEE